MIDFKNEYIDWIRKNTEQIALNSNITRLTSPFLDVDNDCIEIFIYRDGDNIIINDAGETLSSLELSNIKFHKNSKRKKILEEILNSHGIKLSENNELYVECSTETFGMKANFLMQCMIKVSDMFMLSDNTIKTVFIDDVRNYFDKNNIIYLPDINIKGKSSYYANYDFCIPRNKNYPERFIKPINHVTETNIKSAIFTWNDVKPERKDDSILYVLINDIDKNIKKDSTQALTEYGIKYILWSTIDKNIELLRL